jgi:hypothetical protein
MCHQRIAVSCIFRTRTICRLSWRHLASQPQRSLLLRATFSYGNKISLKQRISSEIVSIDQLSQKLVAWRSLELPGKDSQLASVYEKQLTDELTIHLETLRKVRDIQIRKIQGTEDLRGVTKWLALYTPYSVGGFLAQSLFYFFVFVSIALIVLPTFLPLAWIVPLPFAWFFASISFRLRRIGDIQKETKSGAPNDDFTGFQKHFLLFPATSTKVRNYRFLYYSAFLVLVLFSIVPLVPGFSLLSLIVIVPAMVAIASIALARRGADLQNENNGGRSHVKAPTPL